MRVPAPVLPFLRAIGDTSDLVGAWSITRDRPRRFRLTVNSLGLYQSEQHALDVAGIIAPLLVPAPYSVVGSPDLAAIIGHRPSDQWRARVSLQLTA